LEKTSFRLIATSNAPLLGEVELDAIEASGLILLIIFETRSKSGP